MTAHQNLERFLPELVAGTLSQERRRALEEHLSDCAECREWVETYQLLEMVLTPVEGHPQADELARFALFSEIDVELDAHLDSCGGCRREVELTREAVAVARGHARDESPGRWRLTVFGRRFALAAAALLLAVATPLLTIRLSRSTETGIYELNGADVGGIATIAADNSIIAAETAILSGAQVTLTAGEVVALGDGFSVGEDASLAIEIRTKNSL